MDVQDPKFAFLSSGTSAAEAGLADLTNRYGNASVDQADVIVALGGDGFMLDTLHATRDSATPVYGMNCGTIGFMMNEFSPEGLRARLAEAEVTTINPLRMKAWDSDGTLREALAINEVSLLRAGPQAAKLRISIDGRVRMEELVCDGALVATPAGSTAYNYSAHGPILPIESEALALTAMSAFRPRRWRGALLPKAAVVRFEVLEPQKRPVMADADGRGTTNAVAVEVASVPEIEHRLLFDPGHGLEERLIREQFT